MNVFENPFACPGHWYRANLHAHTTMSDGDLSPEESANFYEQAGYQVLAITDHDWVTEVEAAERGLLLLPGVELGGDRCRQGSRYHVVGLGVGCNGRMEVAPGATVQDLVNTLREAGGIAFLAHPYWSGLMTEEVQGIDGCFALEVYNTGCDLEILRGYSTVHWDDLLTLGRDYGGLAVDDGHKGAVDHGLGWTMIRAEELSAEAVRDALLRGRYYASTGPELRDLTVSEGFIDVKTSPVVSIAMVSVPELGGRKRAAAAETITSARFALPRARYCRIEATDAAGRTAWSNPFLLDAP
ncbi:MAG: CehA/McbA family metallohydrolase [Armatimonadetes bacterium]|nr:CehA/McbA family metallohydrolase [Armatimonadota bacterium]